MKDNETKAPAILIFKGLSEITVGFTTEDKASLLDAICHYADGKELPKMSTLADIVFRIIKRDIDKNEEKYAQKCERNKRYQEKQKAEKEKRSKAVTKREASPNNKPPKEQKSSHDPAKQNKLTKAQETFLEEFKAYLPNKDINCNISDFPNIDLKALLTAIKGSPQYLLNPQKNKNLKGLRWYLENADKIINGVYKKFDDIEETVKSRASPLYTEDELKKLEGKKG